LSQVDRNSQAPTGPGRPRQAGGPEAAGQYVTFRLEDELYGVRINQVQEIIGYKGLTPIPDQPEFMPGVLNLRGQVTPVIDLRRRFQLPAKEYDRFTVIIIVRLEDRTVGLVVDSISDVITLPQADLQAPPAVANRLRDGYIEAVAQVGQEFLIFLNVDRILGLDELARMDKVG
jgi:purine-binding chemotaxis protein CheW